MAGGAPTGNKNAAKAKIWENAIRAVVDKVDPKDPDGRTRLRKIAEKLAQAAEEGDIAAIKEIGDRLDGKAKQSTEITGADGGVFQAAISVAFVDADRSKG